MSSPSIAADAPNLPFRQDASLIALVGLAHMVSHFSQLLLPPLFPWLKDAFDVSYAQLGFMLTVFFVVSCAVQAVAGFLVDRWGPRPVLYVGLVAIALSCFGSALSTSYWQITFFAGLAGLGNGVFHPVDYTLLNRRVSPHRLGHAYSAHGITGTLGWAIAPGLMTGVAMFHSWQAAMAVAGLVPVAVLVVLWLNHQRLHLDVKPVVQQGPSDGNFDFLRLPAVWLCFMFFFLFATILGVVQAFAPEASRQLHDIPLASVALCLTVYMIGSASGMVVGGFLIQDPRRSDKVVAVAFAVAATMALILALSPMPDWLVPVLFAFMGVASGTAGPSRDLLVKQSTPINATGRVYGVVYGGLDVGQAITPLIFGLLMDHGQFRGVLIGLALVQCILIFSAFKLRSVSRI
ncbi:MAG: MFS transporter [Comamonadaceae bacterium]|jgi:MFS family permease|nr:MFS transporter [Comamonadaceae bacterium]